MSIAKKISRSLEIAKYCHNIVPLWNLGYLNVFTHASRICKQRRFEPYEAYRLGLFQPTFKDDNLENYTSRKVTTKLEKSVNPESWEHLLKDKGLFYRYLMSQGLPMPRLYGIFFQKVPGWSSDNFIPASRSDWENYFEAINADEFVIKPCRGAFGDGVRIFKKNPDGFINTQNSFFKAGDIYNLLKSEKDFDAFIIQERLRNHPEICRLNPCDYLQTIRVTTFIDRNAECKILFAFFKIIGGQNITDNFGDGRKGNMVSIINIEKGTLEPGFITAPAGKGTIYFDKHPQTGVEYDSFQIPRWSEIIELAKKAAFSFLPLRAIGWDIAVTPSDIKIVEGNIWWNPLNRKRWKEIIEEELPYDF
jgi:hypothetical protein